MYVSPKKYFKELNRGWRCCTFFGTVLLQLELIKKLFWMSLSLYRLLQSKTNAEQWCNGVPPRFYLQHRQWVQKGTSKHRRQVAKQVLCHLPFHWVVTLVLRSYNLTSSTTAVLYYDFRIERRNCKIWSHLSLQSTVEVPVYFLLNSFLLNENCYQFESETRISWVRQCD